MMISTKGRYAFRIMLDLAQHREQGFISLKEIAERQRVSVKYLEAIAGRLSKDGLIVAHHGKHGGYQLARSPADISAGEILKSAEGKLAPVACAGTEIGCANQTECLTYPLWKNLDDCIYRYLDSVSLEDVLLGRLRS
ncbi:MAG TPA: RrF2 family transcriptional regulator [Clostridiales bacterium]|nr:RrF2 family transcriptional regulator [Clostridiales bacterium]